LKNKFDSLTVNVIEIKNCIYIYQELLSYIPSKKKSHVLCSSEKPSAYKNSLTHIIEEKIINRFLNQCMIK